MAGTQLPRWSLDSIYPGLDSEHFRGDLKRLGRLIAGLETLLSDTAAMEAGPRSWLDQALAALGDVESLYEQLDSFAYARFSVDTGDTAASAALDRIAETAVPLAGLSVRFRNALAAIHGRTQWPEGYTFLLDEQLALQERQMSETEERLAADLARSGADSWSRLHETVSSSLDGPWDGERRTVVELRQLAYDADRSVRQRAWRTELAAWSRVETSMAFALNGVKGATHTLNRRRGWQTTLERSARQNRLSRAALEAMIETMRDARPMFERYMQAKARSLGLEQLAFYDLFAPVGSGSRSWDYPEAMAFIATRLGEFDPEQGAFVEHVRQGQWIDAQPRAGKVGGAYCIDFPVAGESRIMANFDGSFDGMSTLAHELGHAWHSHQLRDLPPGQRQYPMTLAETASIFSETLVFHGARAQADPAEERYLVEQFLQGATQVIVDILSRYLFEQRVMERRAQAELSAAEFCSLMREAQIEAYGAGLDHEQLHPYMWAVKGHYYRAELAFYNFPYAFGQLFGLGLHEQYQRAPDGFAERYRALLRETGRADAVTVTAQAGFDIESRDFWEGSMAAIGRLVDRFVDLSEHEPPGA